MILNTEKTYIIKLNNDEAEELAGALDKLDFETLSLIEKPIIEEILYLLNQC